MFYQGIMQAAEEIRKALQNQTKSSSPPATGERQLSETPPFTDYTSGMSRPDITTIKKNLKFEGTPNRSSAFLVALGNIMQDQNNVKALNEDAAQKEYDAKLQDAVDLNKLQNQEKVKREWDESDPLKQLLRRKTELDIQDQETMLPLKEQMAKTRLDVLLQKGKGGGGSNSGEGQNVESVPSGFKAILMSKIKEYDPNTKQPIITPDVAQAAYQEFLLTSPKGQARTAADKFMAPYQKRTEQTAKFNPFAAAVQHYMDQGMDAAAAYKQAKNDGYKPEKSLQQFENESAAKSRGAMRGSLEAFDTMGTQTPTPQPTPTPAPQPAAPQKTGNFKDKVVNGKAVRFYEYTNGGWDIK